MTQFAINELSAFHYAYKPNQKKITQPIVVKIMVYLKIEKQQKAQPVVDIDKVIAHWVKPRKRITIQCYLCTIQRHTAGHCF